MSVWLWTHVESRIRISLMRTGSGSSIFKMLRPDPSHEKLSWPFFKLNYSFNSRIRSRELMLIWIRIVNSELRPSCWFIFFEIEKQLTNRTISGIENSVNSVPVLIAICSSLMLFPDFLFSLFYDMIWYKNASLIK
jgi:hypothetical protein